MYDGKNARKKFEESVRAHRNAFEQRKSLALAQLPELGLLLEKRRQLWLRAIQTGEDPDITEAESENILQEIRSALESNGFRPSDLWYEPLCPICGDTGYVNGKQCSCLKQTMIEGGYLRSNLKTVLENENFDRFDEKMFSDKKGKEQRSPRENILLVRDHCLEYVASFDRSEESILFVGAVGTGKTFMSHCIAKALLDSGRTVVYFTAYDLVDRVADFSFGNADASEKELVLDSDLLIVDDLGCERQTEFAQSALFNVLNERLVRGKKMLISTNLSTKEIKDVYNSRFFSRLIGNFTGFKFIGADLRVHEKN